jgi:hypothetical protein
MLLSGCQSVGQQSSQYLVDIVGIEFDLKTKISGLTPIEVLAMLQEKIFDVHQRSDSKHSIMNFKFLFKERFGT